MGSLLGLFVRSLFCSSIIILIAACSHHSSLSTLDTPIPDFISGDGPITSKQAALSVHDYDLLHVSDQMKEYFDPYLTESMTKWQRAHMLNTLLRGSAFLNMKYLSQETVTAEQAFMQENANCIGFANIYIALARHYGVDVKYQLIKKFPEWSRQEGGRGQMMSLAIHMNSLINLPHGRQMVFDVTPRVSLQSGKPEIISDDSAKALFYSNLAIDEFAKRNYVQAYSLLTKAMTFDVRMDMLWVNLGAVFRHNNQLADAEAAYRVALQINPNSFTAMNNLAVLYYIQENWELFDIYTKRTEQHRQKNPYYHFQLALDAEQDHDYSKAIDHVLAAIKLKDNEPEFLDMLSKLHSLDAKVTSRDLGTPVNSTLVGLNQ